MIDSGQRLLLALEEAEVHLQLIQDYRKGANYDLNQVRDNIISLKEKLSQIQAWSLPYTKGVLGKEVALSFGDLPQHLDVALTLMELQPQVARVLLQLALTMGTWKLEDALTIISTVKELVRQTRQLSRR